MTDQKKISGNVYNKKISEDGEISQYYHSIEFTLVDEDQYAIYYTFESPTTNSKGTAIKDKGANTMVLNYRKLDGSDNQVTGTLYSIGNGYYRGLRFFQKSNTSTTFIQLHMNDCECNETICDLTKLSQETDGFTKINGETLPGTLATLVDSTILLNQKNADGQQVYMVRSTRKAGTRVGIHVHKYGGYTLILSGTMTDFVQGQPVKTYGPNSGYYMPPCTPMSAANLGEEDVELIDIFIGPPCEAFITVVEPEWSFPREGKFDC